MKTEEKIASLRSQMRENGVDVCVVLSSDVHLSEYVPKFYKFREWLSGFSGSAGSLVVSQERVVLCVDGRYTIQAKRETSPLAANSPLGNLCGSEDSISLQRTQSAFHSLESSQPTNLIQDARIPQSNLPHSHTANARSLDSKIETKNEILESNENLNSPSLRESETNEAIHNTESKSVESSQKSKYLESNTDSKYAKHLDSRLDSHARLLQPSGFAMTESYNDKLTESRLPQNLATSCNDKQCLDSLNNNQILDSRDAGQNLDSHNAKSPKSNLQDSANNTPIIQIHTLDSTLTSFLMDFIQSHNSSNLKDSKQNSLVLGLDFATLPQETMQELHSKLPQITLKDIDFASLIWRDRGSLPSSKIFLHTHCSKNTSDKLTQIRQAMGEADYHIISSLDDVAYITNLRGNDIEFNPVFLAYLAISRHNATLFVNISNLTRKALDYLKNQGVNLREYSEFWAFLEGLKGQKILLDFEKSTARLTSTLMQENEIIASQNPSIMMKALKDERELGHIREAMISDGVALCRFMMWLEAAFRRGERISELDIDERLTHFRAKNPLYISPSFATIAGFNANGALPHYQATKTNFSQIRGDGLLLVDSGAQYQNGTTDITRVFGVGCVSAAQRRDYTTTLKGLIALSKARFPLGTPMIMLDSIARASLWAECVDYKHGTGHGVGYFLNVHEGPQRISPNYKGIEATRAAAGMVTSIEPGIYREGQWGVRLENLVATKRCEDSHNGDFGEFLEFETLTLCPFERDCIDESLLNDDEKIWINDYHKVVFERLAPHLSPSERTWLESKTINL